MASSLEKTSGMATSAHTHSTAIETPIDADSLNSARMLRSETAM